MNKKKIIKSVIKINSGEWKHDILQNGNNRYRTYIDNYTAVEFNVLLIYIGNHPPEIKENNQYKAAIKHVITENQNYYLLVNSSEKIGPLYFEKYVSSTIKDGKTSMVREKIEYNKESYITDLINIDGGEEA